jgi:hypothetical protein
MTQHVSRSKLLKSRNLIARVAFCLFAAAGAFAAQITGTVTNGTTNRPSSGDEVVLLSLSNGMDEVSHTKTDSHGHYSLNVPDEQALHLVRAARQSVQYFTPVPAGTTTADVTIYDAATQLESVATYARVFHFQASGGTLDVSDMYVIKNQSLPPRSKIGNQTFAVTLPDGAELRQASITGPGGKPLPVAPVPSAVKNHYAFDFPIRPGETSFEVVYKLPYSGQYEFSLTPDTPLNELGVLLPKSMKFTGVSSDFPQDRDEAGLAVFFTKNVPANQPVKFSLAGEGLVPEEGSQGAPDTSSGSQSDAPATPSNAVPTRSSALWYIVGVIAGVIVGCALVLWRKASRKKSAAAKPKSSGLKRTEAQSLPAATEPDDMLNVLKEELFQLETDRVNGKISDEEYERSKAGLDTLLRRQMSRK